MFARIKKWVIYTLGSLLFLIALSTIVLSIRVSFSKTLDLAAYQHPTQAQDYVALPFSGKNFQVNSYINYGVGRYYLKSKTAATILAAYDLLEQTNPMWQFTYAEMGWNGGGRFRPHRTHREGMNADFMTPVYQLDADQKAIPAALPCHVFNLWGYGVRMDNEGKYKHYHIDAQALIAHIAALEQAGKGYNVSIKRVILDPPLLKLLQAHPDFKTITHINFMQGNAWFPHDGHYHIDFQ
ncbi:MAG: hypothetical protein ACRCWR_03890 [Saezia sp.]